MASSVPIVEVLENLHRLRVPLVHPVKRTTMTAWERIQYYAENYAYYQSMYKEEEPLQVHSAISATSVDFEELFDADDARFGVNSPKESESLVTQQVTEVVSTLALTRGQDRAWTKLLAWFEGTEQYFILRGYAGTGKTYLMQLMLTLKKYTFAFTAPTNKATDVLAEMLGQPAKTVFSYLGLRMVQDGEKLTLSYPEPDKMPYIRKGTILVVDEASAVGSDLLRFIDEVAKRFGIRVIFVGDPMQLNPIGEVRSPAWLVTSKPECKALLTEVKRYDNQLLKLATALRKCIKEKNWVNPTIDDHDKHQGVFVLSQSRFEDRLLKDITPDSFARRKVIAWRNKTVERYNMMIRTALGFYEPYCVSDRLLLASPVERDGTIIATIDEEGIVTSVQKSIVALPDYDVDVYAVTLKLKKIALTLKIIDEKHEHILQSILTKRATAAKRETNRGQRAIKWSEFWDIKNQFNDVRYAYGLTAHRIQGSTLDEAFVDQQDILCNSRKREAFCALYVANTRPTTKLFTF